MEAQARPDESRVLVNCSVVDGSGAPPTPDAGVWVRGTRIEAIGPVDDVLAEAGDVALRHDLGGAFVTPGLMNMHVHLGLTLPGAAGLRLALETEAALVLRMAANARRALHAGVTTLRLVGEARHADFALRAAIDAGRAEGPRLFTAGRSIACTGGHGHTSPRTIEADGPSEFRKAVRAQLRAGADHVKVMLTGGIAGEHEGMDDPQLAPEELRAVTETAHAWGRKVTAHAGPAAAIERAIADGLDGVEHGYGLDEEVAALMAERGVWLVPTIVVGRCEDFFARIGAPPWMVARSLESAPTHWRSLQTALRAGVPIALGTDMLPAEELDETTATVRELEYYVEAGMTPLEALRAATALAAELLGVADEVGTVAAGKAADLLAVDGDPSRDASAFRRIRLVMKDGRVVREGA